MRRHERAAILIIGAGITPVVGPFVAEKLAIPGTTVFAVGSALVGVIGGVAGVLRFFWIRRALRERDDGVVPAREAA